MYYVHTACLFDIRATATATETSLSEYHMELSRYNRKNRIRHTRRPVNATVLCNNDRMHEHVR